VAEIELAEKEKMKDKVDLICNHDINVFINRQLIYNYPEQVSETKKNLSRINSFVCVLFVVINI
jgi:hypothetical protein